MESPPPLLAPGTLQKSARSTPAPTSAGPGAGSGSATSRSPGHTRSRLRLALLAFGGALTLGASFLAWDATRSGPVWFQWQKLTGKIEAPHPAGRWYAFGYRHGQTQAATARSLGVPVVSDPADLAYALQALGMPHPPPQAYDLCLQGFRDGLAARPQRYLPEKNPTGDAFPEALSGL